MNTIPNYGMTNYHLKSFNQNVNNKNTPQGKQIFNFKSQGDLLKKTLELTTSYDRDFIDYMMQGKNRIERLAMAISMKHDIDYDYVRDMLSLAKNERELQIKKISLIKGCDEDLIDSLL